MPGYEATSCTTEKCFHQCVHHVVIIRKIAASQFEGLHSSLAYNFIKINIISKIFSVTVFFSTLCCIKIPSVTASV